MISKNPHVSIKISGLGYTHNNWNQKNLTPYITTILKLFSADRVMFASNFPVDKVLERIPNHTYTDLFNVYKQIIADLGASQIEQHKLFFGNAKKFYRL